MFLTSSYSGATLELPRIDTTIDVDVADTFLQKYRGLSIHDSPDDFTGLLFVHLFEKEHSYVMRGMSFPIDILFLTSEFVVSEIHSDVAPNDGLFDNYSGRGKYVLEVPAGWASDNQVGVGDLLPVTFHTH